MIYLIWSCLNITIFLVFLYLLIGFLFRGKRIFGKRFKALSVFLLVFGCIYLITANQTNEDDNKIILTDNVHQQTSVHIAHKVVEDGFPFKVHLLMEYGNQDHEQIPLSGTSYLSGFHNGFKWKTQTLSVNQDHQNNQTRYNLTGSLSWYLFGIQIYTQNRTYSGKI